MNDFRVAKCKSLNALSLNHKVATNWRTRCGDNLHNYPLSCELYNYWRMEDWLPYNWEDYTTGQPHVFDYGSGKLKMGYWKSILLTQFIR